MAVIRGASGEKTVAIRQWLGVNESPDGGAGLKYGEAAKMVNFAVTRDGALIKRPGTKTVMGLASSYGVAVSPEAEVVRTDLNAPNWSVTAYPARRSAIRRARAARRAGDGDGANLSSHMSHHCELTGGVVPHRGD